MSAALALGAGVGIGLAAAVPVGPVNLLVLSLTLREGRAAGLRAGLGALAADVLAATVAAFGLAGVVAFVDHHAGLIETAGGLVLAGFGIALLAARPHLPEGEPGDRRRSRPLAAFLATLGNPGTLFGMLALFGAARPLLVDASGEVPPAHGLAAVAGVALGGLLWWTVLTGTAARLGRRLDDRWLKRLDAAAGLLLLAAGAALAARGGLALAGY